MDSDEPNETTDLSNKKEALDVKKLALEISELERSWWKRPTYIMAALPTILAIVTLTYGLTNGYFSASFAKLENQKIALENEIKEFQAKRDQLHRQNDALVLAISHYNSGLAHFYIQENKQAIEEYTKAIEADPSFSWAYYDRGVTNAVAKEGNRDIAIADLTKAIELNPTLAKAYYFRGYAYHVQSKYNLALADYTKAIEIDPLFADSYGNRAEIYGELGDIGKREADLKQFNELKPKPKPK